MRGQTLSGEMIEAVELKTLRPKTGGYHRTSYSKIHHRSNLQYVEKLFARGWRESFSRMARTILARATPNCRVIALFQRKCDSANWAGVSMLSAMWGRLKW